MDKDIPQSQPNVPGSLPQPITGVPNTPQGAVPPQDAHSSSMQEGAQQLQNKTSTQPSTIAAPQDIDTIEPEWVNHVNNLMQQKISDPRSLSQEFAKLKSQYIAGRYGKEIKHSNGEE